MSKSSADSFKKALDSLTAARDEARLGLHLLSLDAKKKWDELELKAVALEMELGERAEELTETSAKQAQELSRVVHEFVDSYIRKIHSATRPGGS